MKPSLRLPLVLVLWTAAGCVSTHPAGAFASPAMSRPDRVTVQVENHHWQDVNVYLLRDHLRVRLGTVVSMSSAVFQVRGNLVTGANQVRLTAEPIGPADSYLTEAILVLPGQRLRLQLENNLLLSYYSIR